MSDDHPPKSGASKRSKCPRRFEIIRAFVEEASLVENESVRSHVVSCSKCQAILQSLEQEKKTLQNRYPFNSFFPQLVEGARRRQLRQRLLFRLAPVASVLVFLVLWVVVSISSDIQPTILTKGEVSLGFYVQQGHDAVPGRSGGVYHENDRIQFAYSSGSYRYLFLVSLDKLGRVSNFNYQGAKISVPVVPGNNRLLKGSIILDDTLGPERVFGIFSDKPLSQEEIHKAAVSAYQQVRQRGGSVREIDRLPLSYPQASILLIKQ